MGAGFGTLVVRGCPFTASTATYGGAIHNAGTPRSSKARCRATPSAPTAAASSTPLPGR
jgi:hypothetical protein